MREWNLNATDPLSLTIAADARFDPVDFCNDQIWRLSLRGGEPPSLSVQTTYGLRARLMRIFPLFIHGNITSIDPATYYQPPRITRFYPNYVRLIYSPHSGIDVVGEYWVPSSQVLACRTTISNSSVIPQQERLEWAVMLSPMGENEGMVPTQVNKVPILSGETSDLKLIFSISGNPFATTGPFPNLGLDLDLAPGNERQLIWACTALKDHQSSFDLASSTIMRSWEIEVAHLEMANMQQSIEIETGDTAWDATFAFSQKVAANLIMGPASGLPYPSFVLSRQPDQGYSPRGDGKDLGPAWIGQTPLEAYYLSCLILPGSIPIIKNVVRNFLATQNEDGFVDGKPGLAGQRSHYLATPLLAGLAWKVFQSSQDKSFLAEVFPGLLKFVQAWFQPAHDRDQDNFPEWDLPNQAGFGDLPFFAGMQPLLQDTDIADFESPELASFLFHEIQCLSKIADQINRSAEVHGLVSRADSLRKNVEKTWDPKLATYHYRDRDTHLSLKGGMLTRSNGSGVIVLDRILKKPRRLQIHVISKNNPKPQVSLSVHGTALSGMHIEKNVITSRSWHQDLASQNTKNVFNAIERVEVRGIAKDEEVIINTVDCSFEDITLLLPLWAQIPRTRRAETLVKKTVMKPERYYQQFGLQSSPLCSTREEVDVDRRVYLTWNLMVAEGLLAYGYRTEAADLLTRLMSAIVPALIKRQAFYQRYDANTGEPSGDKDTLDGLAPVGLFLEILGVQLISPFSVIIKGFNPFSWPVTVKYRGMTVIRQEKQTLITFPDGQTASLSGAGHHWVSLV